MIVKCENCAKYFDDEFRTTRCPHDAFLANNGRNRFARIAESYIGDAPVKRCTKTIIDNANTLWPEKQCCKIAGHAGPHYTW